MAIEVYRTTTVGGGRRSGMYAAPVIPGPAGARRPAPAAGERLVYPFDRRLLYDLETMTVIARHSAR